MEASSSSSSSISENPRNTIALKTSDGIVIDVEENIAMEFTAVKLFYEGNPDAAENSPTPMHLENVSMDILNKVITYCQKHLEFRANSTPEEEVISFDADFVKKESTEMLLEIILAANYLEVKDLLDLMTQSVADRIKNKSIEYVRQLFGIVNDFTPDEEAALHQEHARAFEGVDSYDYR